jgi:signal transduction histidine kinase
VSIKPGQAQCRTAQGLRRFAGNDALPDPRIGRIVKAKAGGVWVHAGLDWIVRIRGNRVTSARQTGFPGNVLALEEEPDGRLNVFLDHGWLELSVDGSRWTSNFLLNASVPHRVLSWGRIGPNEALAVTGDGLNRIVKRSPGIPVAGGERWNWIHRLPTGETWSMSKGGGLLLGLTNRSEIVPAASLPDTPPVCLKEDREGNVWLGTDHGLFQIRQQPVTTFGRQDGLPSDDTWSVCEGADGTIWVATKKGLGAIRSNRVAGVSSTDPRLTGSMLGVWPSDRRGVWVGLDGDGADEYRVRGEEPENAGMPTGSGPPTESAVRTDLPRRKGSPLDVAIKTSGDRLEALSYGRNGVLLERHRTMTGRPDVLYADRENRLWLGASEGLWVLGTNGPLSYTDYLPECPFGMRDVRAILKSKAGDYWIGTKGHGILRFGQGQWSRFGRKDGLGDDVVLAIHEDQAGSLWLGTERGLCRWTAGRFFAFRKAQGVRDGTVYSVLEDGRGHLWFSGQHGLCRASIAELEAVARGELPQVRTVTLGVSDGMGTAECNGEYQPAGWKAGDGRLWYPTSRGVVVVDPMLIADEPVAPLVVIESVRTDDQAVFGENAPKAAEDPAEETSGRPAVVPKPFRINSSDAHVVEFRYTANTFIEADRSRFQYRLLGVDRGWREETTARTARYVTLPPGSYQFEVRAADLRGVWSAVPAVFAFELLPSFWQTRIFYWGCGAGVFGLAAMVQAYRLRWQRRLLKLEERQTVAHERTRIARDLHDELGTGLTGLALELDVVGKRDKEKGATAKITETAQRMRDLAERMREVVWAVNPACDTLSSLASYLEQQVGLIVPTDAMGTFIDFPEEIPDVHLPSPTRHQLALCVRESLANVVRHAHASEVRVRLRLEPDHLRLDVEDNGVGMIPNRTPGNGLGNMKARIERLGGNFEIHSSRGKGTVVRMEVPLADIKKGKT